MAEGVNDGEKLEPEEDPSLDPDPRGCLEHFPLLVVVLELFLVLS